MRVSLLPDPVYYDEPWNLKWVIRSEDKREITVKKR